MKHVYQYKFFAQLSASIRIAYSSIWINSSSKFKHVNQSNYNVQTCALIRPAYSNIIVSMSQYNQHVQTCASKKPNCSSMIVSISQCNQQLEKCSSNNTSQMTNDNHNVQTRTSYNLYVQTWVSIWIKISILRHVRECNMISMHIHLHQSEQNVEAFPSIRRASLNIPINKTFIFKHECQWEPCHKHTPIWPAQSRMSVSCRR